MERAVLTRYPLAGRMKAVFRLLCICLGLILAAAATARAEEGTAEPAAPAPPAPSATDIGDVWRLLRHKTHVEADLAADAASHRRFLVIAPSIGSKPSTGFTLGFSGNVAFFGGDPGTTHISSISGSFKYSQKGQMLSGGRFAVFTQDDRWFVQGDARLSLTSQNTYDFGTEALASSGTNAAYTQRRLYETVYRQIAPRLFVGGGLSINNHSDVRPTSKSQATWDDSAYVTYSEKHGFALDGQTSAGTSVGLLYDTRDNGINAQRGVLVSATYRTFFDGFLGGDSTWQELFVDMRTYRKLSSSGRQKLAFWFQDDMVTGGVAPYLDLPSTASNERSARGYSEGRYRGDHLVYGEMEYRGTITRGGLLGFVAFVNTTTIGSQETGEKLFESFAPGGGMGMRVLLNKRSRTNLCTDYGWGKQGSRGFYLSIQEAF
jgi:outer membrane protein assembly factor BamA